MGDNKKKTRNILLSCILTFVFLSFVLPDFFFFLMSTISRLALLCRKYMSFKNLITAFRAKLEKAALECSLEPFFNENFSRTHPLYGPLNFFSKYRSSNK